MSISNQIKLAKKSIRRSKSATPYLFPEWQHLQQCKILRQQAEVNYEEAKRVWDSLGK